MTDPGNRRVADDLRRCVGGTVAGLGDPDFEAAQLRLNRAVWPSVSAVVEVAGTDDVAAVVRYAGDNDLSVAPRTSGHGVTCAGADKAVILLDTGRLDGLSVDARNRVARVGAGVRWGGLQHAVAGRGLTGLAGSALDVGVVGYVLGGGVGWFSRGHGWAADSVRAFEVVDADAVLVEVTRESDPELFWALRGGGGDVAVVTAVETALHPAPSVYSGRMVWPLDRLTEVVAAFRHVTSTASNRLTLWLDVQRPPGGGVVSIALAHLGGERVGRAATRPLERIGGLLADTRCAVRADQVSRVTAEPVALGPVLARGEVLTELCDDVVSFLRSAGPRTSLHLRHLGGALHGPSDSPHGPQEGDCALFLIDPRAQDDAAVRAGQRDAFDHLAGSLTARKPHTFLDRDESVTRAFPTGSLARLRRLKLDRDPEGRFRGNFPVLEG